MNLSEAYSIIAKRFLESAEKLVSFQHEGSAFFSYHAFESLGGALCERMGAKYPRSHRKKIYLFLTKSKLVDHKFSHAVSVLDIIFTSLSRNKMLYPERLPDGRISIPEDLLNENVARDLVRRVKGVFRKLKKYLL